MPPILDIEEYIDGQKASRIYYDCIRPEILNSSMCDVHRQHFLALLASGKVLAAQDLPEVQDPNDVTWEFKLTDTNVHNLKQRLEALHGALNMNSIWCVDFEGFCAVKKGFSPTPLAAGFINAGTRQKISDPIKYNQYSNIDKTVNAIMAGGTLPSFVTCSRARETLKRHYGGEKIVGLTLREWKDKLFALGFKDTHLVVTWGFTNLDRLGVGHIMAEEFRLNATTDRTLLKAEHLDLMAVFRYHSNIHHFRLWFIYPTFVKGDHTFHWHDALYDTRVTSDLYFVAKRYTTPAALKFKSILSLKI